MKKHDILTLACFLTAAISYSQTLLIRDKSTLEPLQNVIIQDINKTQTISNIKGIADVSTLNKNDSLLIYQFGYNTKKVLLNSSNTAETIELSSKSVILDEIILSANRKSEHKIDVPYNLEIIKQKDIEFSNPATSGDMLQNTGMLFLQKSQAGGGSPSMRGFEANKVLMVIDGVRLNNAIYRGGHLQDVMTIDPNMLDRTEIIFGPSSTIYGSDALGGVMHFYTKNAQFSNDTKLLLKTNAMVRYGSAVNEQTGHLDFNLGWKKFASLTNLTFSNFGDVTSGATKLTGYSNTWDRVYFQERINNRDTMSINSNNNLQRGSGYSQIDIMQRFNIKTGEHLIHNINFQYGASSFLPRYDRLNGDYTSGKFRWAENGYGPQKRLLGAYTLNFDKKTAVTDNLKVILAYQKIDQDRITRRWQKTARTSQREDVTVLSANIDAYKLIKEEHELRYGFEFTTNDVKSVADTTNIVAGGEGKAQTRYPDGGSKMNTIAVYVSHAWEVTKNFVITDGLRFTNTNLSAKFIDTTFKSTRLPFDEAKQNNQAVTGSLGFTWKSENDYKVSLLANTGFRSPNIDDMTKVFEGTGGIVIVPNADLKPEYSYNFEMGLSKVIQGKYKFDITGFYTSLTNALVLRDFKFNGLDSATYQGVKSKVQATQNADNAYIMGLSGGIQFDFNENISFKSVINYSYGRYNDTKNDTVIPLDHIAPLFGQTSLLYKAKQVDGEFFIRYNGKKSLSDYSPSGEDNLPYATKNGMPAWFTLNIRLGINITKNFRLNASCENLTDNRYRQFASGINAPGRNLIISLRYKM
ncbi:MAG: TonB-dependent receptor [Bacteroidota bacterium]|nr:TonB-dependent receptor [Bacteroidota bacterium]